VTSDTLSNILTSIIDISVTNSYTLKRWKRVIKVLLEKTEDKPTINKFHTIHLVESDLNFVMCLLWGKEMMLWSESHKAISDNQYGGMRGIHAQSAALSKALTLNVIRYYGEEATIVDNVAQACYDRIVPVVLVHALLRLGYELISLSTPYKSLLDSIFLGQGRVRDAPTPSWASLSDLISKVADRHSRFEARPSK